MDKKLVGLLIILLLNTTGTSCSLIVGSKLEEGEKSTVDGKVSSDSSVDGGGTDGKIGNRVKGEVGLDYVVIGETIEIEDEGGALAGATFIRIKNDDGSTMGCPGHYEGKKYFCSIPSMTHEGTAKLYNDKDELIEGTQLEIRRMILVGGLEGRSIKTLDAATLEPLPQREPIPLPGSIGDEMFPLLSPSGRFLLLSLHQLEGPTLTLIDVVRGDVQVLGMNGDEFYRGQQMDIIPHSFEPNLFQVDLPGYPLPAMVYFPEEKLWLVAKGEDIFEVNIPETFQQKKAVTTRAIWENISNVHQLRWVPDYQGGKYLVGVTPNLLLVKRPDMLLPRTEAVGQAREQIGECLQVAYAMPGKKNKSEVLADPVFLVLCKKDNSADSLFTVFGYAVRPGRVQDLKINSVLAPNTLLPTPQPSSLVTIPGTSLTGLSNKSNPANYTFLFLLSENPLYQQDSISGVVKTPEGATVTSLPTKYYGWGILVHTAQSISIVGFNDQGQPKPILQHAIHTVAAAHHPYNEEVFGLNETHVLRFNYSAAEVISKPIPEKDFEAGGQLLIQP